MENKTTYNTIFIKVTDIADAMILKNLLSSFIEKGMTIITTSNRHPDGKIICLFVFIFIIVYILRIIFKRDSKRKFYSLH